VRARQGGLLVLIRSTTRPHGGGRRGCWSAWRRPGVPDARCFEALLAGFGRAGILHKAEATLQVRTQGVRA